MNNGGSRLKVQAKSKTFAKNAVEKFKKAEIKITVTAVKAAAAKAVAGGNKVLKQATNNLRNQKTKLKTATQVRTRPHVPLGPAWPTGRPRPLPAPCLPCPASLPHLPA